MFPKSNDFCRKPENNSVHVLLLWPWKLTISSNLWKIIKRKLYSHWNCWHSSIRLITWVQCALALEEATFTLFFCTCRSIIWDNSLFNTIKSFKHIKRYASYNCLTSIFPDVHINGFFRSKSCLTSILYYFNICLFIFSHTWCPVMALSVYFQSMSLTLPLVSYVPFFDDHVMINAKSKIQSLKKANHKYKLWV